MKIGIVGCGQFGACLATYLAQKGADVLAMDKNEDVVSRMSGVLTRIVQGDATDEAAVAEAGFGECDAVVIAIGANMEGSILAAMTMKQMNVGRVLAKAATDLHGKVLERIGVDRVLYPHRDMAARAAQLLLAPTILDYVEISEGAGVIDIRAPARMEGKRLADTEIRKLYGVILLAMEKASAPGKQRRTVLVPDSDEVIEKGDVLVLFGPHNKLRHFERELVD